MTDLLTLVSLDGSSQPERILDHFEERTGLVGEPTSDGRTYELESEEHELDVVEALTDIDPAWTEHVGFQDPG